MSSRKIPLDDAIVEGGLVLSALILLIAPNFFTELFKGNFNPGLIWEGAQNTAQQVAKVAGNFETALKLVLNEEGGLNTNPHDRGGRTMKGVTQDTYNAYLKRKGLPNKQVDNITEQELKDLYQSDYWVAAGCDRMAEPLATVCFDTAVNFGVGGAKTFFHDLPSDPVQAAIKIAERRAAYRHQRVAEAPDQNVFLHGWLARDERMKKFAQNYKAPAIKDSKIVEPPEAKK